MFLSQFSKEFKQNFYTCVCTLEHGIQYTPLKMRWNLSRSQHAFAYICLRQSSAQSH